LTSKGGAICGTFLVGGALSVLLYKPWRRRIDKKRLQRDNFVPLPQSAEDYREEEENAENTSTTTPKADGRGKTGTGVEGRNINAIDAIRPAPGRSATTE
jgi:nickel/cobalt transporter (NiCoT) family protein